MAKQQQQQQHPHDGTSQHLMVHGFWPPCVHRSSVQVEGLLQVALHTSRLMQKIKNKIENKTVVHGCEGDEETGSYDSLNAAFDDK